MAPGLDLLAILCRKRRPGLCAGSLSTRLHVQAVIAKLLSNRRSHKQYTHHTHIQVVSPPLSPPTAPNLHTSLVGPADQRVRCCPALRGWGRPEDKVGTKLRRLAPRGVGDWVTGCAGGGGARGQRGWKRFWPPARVYRASSGCPCPVRRATPRAEQDAWPAPSGQSRRVCCGRRRVGRGLGLWGGGEDERPPGRALRVDPKCAHIYHAKSTG